MTKGPEAFRTISEAADELGVPQHVLRFWETKFAFVSPMKRAGGRRFYRPQDLLLLKGVRALLHEEGYTIKGVQRLHREQGVRRLLDAGQGVRGEPTAPADLDAPSGDDAPPPISNGPTSGLSDSARLGLTKALAALEAAKARLEPLLFEG